MPKSLSNRQNWKFSCLTAISRDISFLNFYLLHRKDERKENAKWFIKKPKPLIKSPKLEIILDPPLFQEMIFLNLPSCNSVLFENVFKCDFKMNLNPFCEGEILSKHAGQKFYFDALNRSLNLHKVDLN
jgi:hypothetical protein